MSPSHAGFPSEDAANRVRERLILFVAGDAPRSRRARANLQEALERHGLAGAWPREIDLLRHPEEGVAQGMLATPALLYRDPGRSHPATLYGDLSHTTTLDRFLAATGLADNAATG